MRIYPAKEEEEEEKEKEEQEVNNAQKDNLSSRNLMHKNENLACEELMDVITSCEMENTFTEIGSEIVSTEVFGAV